MNTITPAIYTKYNSKIKFGNTQTLQSAMASTNPQPQNTVANNNSDTVKTTILSINDVHGKMTNMERIYSVTKQFDRTVPEGTDSLKLSSGDFILGANFVSNQVANKFMNWVGVKANTLGNHEMDVVPSKLAQLMDEANYKLLAINAHVAKDSPMYGKIGKSIPLKILPSIITKLQQNSYKKKLTD